MRDFSLLYGPARRWLPVVAIVLLFVVVFVLARPGSNEVEGSCDIVGPIGDSAAGCGDGVSGGDAVPPRDASLFDGGDRAETGQETGRAGRPSGWTIDGDRGAEVPFVSLRPSPEPMTDAGKELVRRATSDESE